MRSILLASLCLLVSACSIFTRSIERPTADVRTVSVQSAGFTGMTGELLLDVANPNGFGVPLAGIDWQLSVGGARAVTGSVELSQTIPAKGVAPVTTSLTIDARDAIVVAEQIARGARTYQLSARLRFSTPVGPLDVDVRHQGQLAEARGLLGAL
ncbi:MAG: LEA type 2 family protein [Kofleriaceae bacterium]|nr:MAG: LEA type 2 family protein [Kofleriaceae bacterium]MBZ0238099.1 LEA type 2 family protein [Kofleriaceae bacterium]